MNIPKRTALPELIDSNLSNTLDFHIASTNFVNIVDKYVNEIALTYLYDYNKYTVDPISKQAEFFKNIDQNNLNLINNTACSKNKNTTLLIANNDVKLSYGEVWITDVADNIESRINPQTQLLEIHALNKSTNTDRWIPVETDITEQVNSKLAKLQDGFGKSNLNPENLYFWYRMYQNSHNQIKQEFNKLIPGEKHVFGKLSDSIGILTRLSEMLDPSISQLFNKSSDETIIPYNCIFNDKIDTNTQNIIIKMSKFVNTLFKYNINSVIENITPNTSSHGQNLVNDYLHYNRVQQIVLELNGVIANEIGDCIEVLYYIQNSNTANDQKILSAVFDVVVEGTKNQLDILKNKLQNIQKETTNQRMLGA